MSPIPEHSGHLCVESPVRGGRARIVRFDGLEVLRTSRDALRLARIPDRPEDDTPTGPGADPALAPDDVRRLVRDAEPRAAWERAIRILTYRDRSHVEVRSALLADGYPEDIVEACIARLLDVGLLDDARFATSLARTKCAAGWSRRRIEAALRTAGVAADVATGAVEQECAADEVRASAMAARWDITTDADSRRAIGRLARKGFDLETCVSVVRARRSSASQ